MRAKWEYCMMLTNPDPSGELEHATVRLFYHAPGASIVRENLRPEEVWPALGVRDWKLIGVARPTPNAPCYVFKRPIQPGRHIDDAI